MPQLEEACPSELDLLLWISGRIPDERAGVIGKHLAACVSCGETLRAAEAAVTDVAEGVADDLSLELPAAEKDALERFAATAKRYEQEVERIFGDEPARWADLVATHPDRGAREFLYRIADRSVPEAEKRPAEILVFVAAVRPVVDELEHESDQRRIRALLYLAEGWAFRTRGEHVAALSRYALAEEALPEPVLELEFPRINLARAASLRRLNRHDEARRALELARQGFARCGIAGEEKALWQLGNIAWEMGDHRTAVKMASRAHRRLVRDGDTREAAIVLWTVVAPLIALRRPSPVRRILARLEREPRIRENPSERARLRWNQGMLAALEHDGPRSRELLAESAATFAEAGNPLDAARVTLDHAHLAGERGELADQLQAAAQAAAILEKVPGHGAEWGAALEELREALRAGATLSHVVAVLRERLRRA